MQQGRPQDIPMGGLVSKGEWSLFKPIISSGTPYHSITPRNKGQCIHIHVISKLCVVLYRRMIPKHVIIPTGQIVHPIHIGKFFLHPFCMIGC